MFLCWQFSPSWCSSFSRFHLCELNRGTSATVLHGEHEAHDPDVKSVFEDVTPLFVHGKFLCVTMCNLIVCTFQIDKFLSHMPLGVANSKNPTLVVI